MPRPPHTAELKPSVAQLLIPAAGASLRRQVEQIPEGLEGGYVSSLLARLGWRVEELGPPEVPDRLAMPVEYVEHRCLCSFRRFGEIVAVIGVIR